VYRSPLSLHGVSHDNMSHDSDQGLTEERAEETNISGYKLWLIPAPAIIYNPPYRITFSSIIYGDPNLYEIFRALLLFECVEREMGDRCQVHGTLLHEIVTREKFTKKLCTRVPHDNG